MKIPSAWADKLAKMKTPVPLEGIQRDRITVDKALELGKAGVKKYRAALRKAQNQRYRERTAVARAIRVATLATVAEENKKTVRTVRNALWAWHGFRSIGNQKLERANKVAADLRQKRAAQASYIVVGDRLLKEEKEKVRLLREMLNELDPQ